MPLDGLEPFRDLGQRVLHPGHPALIGRGALQQDVLSHRASYRNPAGGLRVAAGDQPNDLLPDPVQVRAQPDQHLGGHALALADQAKQDVLGSDVVMTELMCLTQRQLEHLLGPGSERDVPGRRLLSPADDLLDLLAHRLQADLQ
jgi:hypothetical protein